MTNPALPQVAVTNPIHDEIRDLLTPACDLRANDDPALPWDQNRIVEAAPKAQALMAFMTDSADGAFLDRLPDLRILACALKGSDSFDQDACTQRGIWMTIVPDLLTVPTAELTIGLAIGLMRHVMAGDAHVRSGDFKGWRPELYGAGLSGANVGILGMGRLGQAVAERLRGSGAALLCHDRAALSTRITRDLGAQELPPARIAATAGVVIVCLPLNRETRHMVDAAFLARMKPGSYLINTGRGSVVDEDAVAQALESGHLAGYAADVFEMEDWSLPDRPRDIPPRLLARREKTLFTPHIGSAVKQARIEIERSAATAILQVLSGNRPDTAVNDVPLVRKSA